MSDLTTSQAERDQAACLAKLTWKSYEEAIAARAYAQWQYGKDGDGPKPYQCRHCHLWHLASSY